MMMFYIEDEEIIQKINWGFSNIIIENDDIWIK